MTVSISIQYALLSMPTSSSRCERISSLRIPCDGVVAMLFAYPQVARGQLQIRRT
jgi:hypothetical protein